MLRVTGAATAVVGLVWLCQPAHAGAVAPASTTSTTVPPAAKAEVLVDVATGRVLFGENEHLPLPPASLTKMLTAMIAYDWLSPAAVIPVSAQAATVYPDRVGMKAGQRWPLSITLHALLVFSANDAAYALAQRVGGSLANFAVIMREAAAELGLSGPLVLHDPAGLDGREGFEGGNLLSAWDVAIAARDLMANPALASIVALKQYSFTFDNVVYEFPNKNHYFLVTYPDAIGIKTGFTDPAGFCVAEEAVRGGRTMLAVVMNGANSYQTAADLLNQGFSVPVGAEGHDLLLPPERQPEPPSPPPPRPAPPRPPVTERRVIADFGGVDTVGAHPSGASPAPAVMAVVAAGALTLVAAGAVAYRRRTRRRPAGSHSRPR
jgi:serine-type D-Ala-D-Ala carboxypeptidase (penicillin-binding protein 5/6)